MSLLKRIYDTIVDWLLVIQAVFLIVCTIISVYAFAILVWLTPIAIVAAVIFGIAKLMFGL